MTHPRLRFIRKGQRGFTLVELIIAIAIAGLITGGITVAIMQILTINTRASNHMVAVRQVQQAGKEVSKDALQSQSNAINASPSGGDFLVLGWTDWEGLENVVVYTLQVMPSRPDLRTLERSHTINGTEQATAIPVVAEYIDPVLTSCVWNVTAGVLTFTVTAAPGTESETRIYEVEPRPG
jgi:prepilin-type N-terminal cleavage/methylation domain-containing protein